MEQSSFLSVRAWCHIENFDKLFLPDGLLGGLAVRSAVCRLVAVMGQIEADVYTRASNLATFILSRHPE